MRRPAGLLAVPAVAYYAVLFALPLGLLLADSFRGPLGLTSGLYARFLASNYNQAVIWRTLRVAATCTLARVAIGYPAAFALAATRGRVQSLLIAALAALDAAGAASTLNACGRAIERSPWLA